MKISVQVNREMCLQCLVLLVVWGLSSTALAGGVGASLGGIGGGGGMPWDSNVNMWRTSLRSVVCPAMIFGGIVVTAWEALHEGEIKSWGKRGIITMLAGGMALGADSLLRSMSSGGLVM